MSQPHWKDIAELLGITAIVASLIFVGLQLKQSHEIALGAQYQARAETTLNIYASHIEAGYVLRPLQKYVTEAITAQDISMRLWAWAAYDNHHFQYQNGFLTDEAWEGHARSIRQTYNSCALRFAYDIRKPSIRASFVEFVEEPGDPCADRE